MKRTYNRKGSLHFHTVIWGGLLPDLLAKISTYPELCKEAERVLESMYSASMPREVHVSNLVNKELPHYYNACPTFGEKRNKVGRAMLIHPDPVNDKDAFEEFCHTGTCRCGIHSHCMTCRKPPNGYIGCRLAKPSGLAEKTGVVELVDTTKPGQKLVGGKMEVEYKILSHEEIVKRANKDNDGGSHSDGSTDNNSKSDQDDSSIQGKKIFVWEIKRPTLDPLPALPFDLSEQKTPDKDQAQLSTLDDSENGEKNEQKCWYVECLAREMGHIIESAGSDVLLTNLDNQELVSKQYVKNNDVYQVSLNK